MNDLVPGYIEDNYTQELAYELLRTLQVFDYFNYTAIYEKLNNLIMDSYNADKAQTNDLILLNIKEGQDFIFNAHSIKVSEQATITERTELLIALALLMRLEDYEPIITALYSDASDMEILCSIITDISVFDEVQFYSIVDDFDPELLNTLKKYAEGKTVKEDVSDLGRERISIIDNLKVFKELYGEALGTMMLSTGTFVGAKFHVYYPFIKDIVIVKDSPEESAKNMLSALLISSNGNNAPIITYKKNVDRFTDNLELIRKMEPIIVKMIGEMENYKRAKYEQSRLPKASDKEQ